LEELQLELILVGWDVDGCRSSLDWTLCRVAKAV
jgi:hypothetical protein